MSHLVAVDGGGTHTTVAVSDALGGELLRRSGPPGLVDPRDPEGAAARVAEQIRRALAEAGVSGPARALCAGLAGVGDDQVRARVAAALEQARVAERVTVCTDGETALEGAFRGGAGILLIAGTGSIAYARAPDGRVERCGGWGMVVGDEGSGYCIGRAGLRHALRAHDGRGPETDLLPRLLHATRVAEATALSPWAGRAGKAEIAALALQVLEAAAHGDPVAAEIVRRAAADLAAHAAALLRRLPWEPPVPVALHGGMARQPGFADAVARAVRERELPVELREPAADAVAGALGLARRAADA